jgi:hypothetical protein
MRQWIFREMVPRMSAKRHGRTVALIPLLAVLLVAPSRATDWQPITPEELQLKSEPKAPGATAIYLYRQVDRDDSNSETFYYSRLKILKEEGRSYADVEIRYLKGDEQVHGLDARTIRPDGSIVKFDGTVYDKPILTGRGRKYMAKTFTMPEAGVGSIIEYKYRLSQNPRYIFDSKWILSQELFTQHARFSLIPSEYYSLRWSWPRGLPEGTADPSKTSGRIKLETRDVPAFVTEELMPPEDELKYRVDFIYFDEGQYVKEAAAYWKRFAKERFRQVEKFVDRKKAMERAVAEIIQPDDSPETRLRKIYTRVQRIRNESYERPKTEEERKRDDEARNVEEVWTRGSGIDSQINYLFIALARAAGLQASSALCATRNQYFFDSRLMNDHQLNSNIVIVTAAGKDWFLDPGVPFTPFGSLPWYETAVQSLRLDSDGGKWINTLLPGPTDARIERKARLKLESGGTLAGKVTISFTGSEAGWRRLEERNEDDTERRQFLENQLRRSVPSGIEVKLTNTPDWSAWEEPLVAEFDLQIPGWVASAGQRQLLKAGLFGAIEDRTFEHQTRTQPIYFDFPYQYSDDVVIELPTGKHINSLPKARNLDFKTYSYGLTAEEKDGTLHLKRDISVSLLLVNVKFYNQLRDFFQSVRNADEDQVVIGSVVAQR